VLLEVTPELRRRGEQLYGKPEDAGAALAMYSDEQLEFLTQFMHGNRAFQLEKMQELERLKARESGA
jgi:hypothetical protein